MIFKKVIKEYYYFMKNFSIIYFNYLNKSNKTISKEYGGLEYIEDNIDLELNKDFINANIYDIDNSLFQKMFEKLYILKNKLTFIYNYKKEFLSNLEKSNDENIILKDNIDSYYSDEIENIITSNITKYSGTSTPVIVNYEYKENFQVNDENIIPIFNTVNKLDFEHTKKNNGRVHLTLFDNSYVSKIELSFTKDIRDSILIGYKKSANDRINYIESEITLKRNKVISLMIEDCYEIILYSNNDFNSYISGITLFGGNNSSETIIGSSILSLEDNYNELLIDSEDNINFFLVKNPVVLEELSHISYMDLRNNNFLEYIDNNTFQKLQYSKGDKIIMRFTTDTFLMNKPKIYGKIDRMVIE